MLTDEEFNTKKRQILGLNEDRGHEPFGSGAAFATMT
ncbi:MAG: hypothetical protein M3132_12630 [Actinomycetia bacterium]|nr:hypothetical protein [Actinomycetes bacterium]